MDAISQETLLPIVGASESPPPTTQPPVLAPAALSACDNRPADQPTCPAAGRCARSGHPCAIAGRAAALLILCSLVVTSGCVKSLNSWAHNHFKLGPNYSRPGALVSPQYVDVANPQLDVDPEGVIAGKTPMSRVTGNPTLNCSWWSIFNDSTLDDLINTAYRGNLDMRTAAARILEARGRRAISIGNLFPQTQQLQANYAHGQISRNLGGPFGGLGGPLDAWVVGGNISWELDFWGRYRRMIESSNANLERSVEDYGDVLVLTLSEVATNYVQMRTFEERLNFAERNVIIQRNSLRLAEEKFTGGVATELDVRQLRSNLAQTESLIPPLIAGRRQAANRLCVLMGYPATDLADQLPPGTIPIAPAEVAVGIPANLLRQRPDVNRAERDVAAQSAQIGVAEADLYPRLQINGFLGYAAADLSDLFNPKSTLGLILPTVQWNVLNYGRILNNIAVQDARLQQLALQYQQNVLRAGREVEDALVGFIQAQQQAARLEASVREAEASVQLVVTQYEGGVSDINRLFNAQTTLVNQQDQLATARGAIALNLIQVYRGLGGGWEYFRCGQCLPNGATICPLAPGSIPLPKSENIPPGKLLEPSGVQPEALPDEQAPPEPSRESSSEATSDAPPEPTTDDDTSEELPGLKK
jgi:NodT family efflux transporter outer membrane factor (OMF) lipoprotein